VYFQIWKLRLCHKKEEGGGWCSLLVMMFGGAVFRVQCTFPNMESEAVPNEK
jgi:hypothetical protein